MMFKMMYKEKKEKFLSIGLPCLLLLLGAVLRLSFLGEVPGGYHRDEAYSVWNAFALFHDGVDSSGHSWPVYFEAWAHGQSALNTYLILPLIGLAGGNASPFLVRLPQALVAVATLAVVYLLLKKLTTPAVACWGLFLLAICPWHVMMSRWGLDANLAPGFLVFGLYFFVLGMEKAPFLLASALCYGLSLYCYATIWPVVPVMLALQLIYGFVMKRIRLRRWLLLSLLLLGVLALPLLLFLLVNMELLPEIRLGCFSIYRMSEFRGGELAHSLSEVWNNIRNTGYLLKHQDVGQPYDVIMPYGFFYEIGRVFIVIGVAALLAGFVRKLRKREFAWEWFLLVQLFGAGMVGSLVWVTMHKINCLYIPLVMCEALGVNICIRAVGRVCRFIGRERAAVIGKGAAGLAIAAVFAVNLAGFQKAYYTDYRKLAGAYFQEGSDEAVKEALRLASEKGADIYVHEGLKYPNVLLAARVTGREYLDTLVYSDYRPAPAQFDKDGVTFYMGIDYDNISKDQVYVIYYTDLDYFTDFQLTQYQDWYVGYL